LYLSLSKADQNSSLTHSITKSLVKYKHQNPETSKSAQLVFWGSNARQR